MTKLKASMLEQFVHWSAFPRFATILTNSKVPAQY